MTKNQLIHRVAEKAKLTKKDTELVINIVFDSITEALKSGEKVELRGFGSFRTRNRNSRDGRNPKTGTPVKIPSKKIPFFKAGKDLKDLVNGDDDDGGDDE
ncbi:MAG: HU family DNA-binding protein [Candidatus Tectomicrobia bacterium]|uniref:HU family DNA-binding protein n=1 Tax=Tectimicrobiota bacterium TaxID=2528274 RepID=A0A932CMK3_UNCTE|nr:HU family DNA-binding protein [Candidatus Tectomicrobia bacterium]